VRGFFAQDDEEIQRSVGVAERDIKAWRQRLRGVESGRGNP